jgi:3-oxoacyl-[acyl-carrier-protein] synthase II
VPGQVRRRVVITGSGVITAGGNDLDSFWSSLTAGKTLLGVVKNFTCPEMDVLPGAEAELPADELASSPADQDPFAARCALFALAAARRALAHAGLAAGHPALADAGVVLGTTMAEERQVGSLCERWAAQGADSVDRDFLVRADNHTLATRIASAFGMGGPVLLNATACSSGNASIAWGYDAVAEGTADVMLAGGADTFTRSLFCGFARMSALSKTVCKPFDKNRDGVSFGEGAGILVLEELEHARGRGARILAEVLGYGLSNDAYHVTAPEPNGAGFVRAIQQALASSGTPADGVDYICAHGTGTQYNDQGEVRAIKAVFGGRATRIPTSSIKSTIGHTNGAAAAIAAIACVLALVKQMVPPTANLAEPDPEFGMDFVIGQGRPATLSTCLNVSAGFGGANACLLLARAP